MIISHKHKFIFIKTQKTAGTSIEIALSRLCGDDDVITPISKKDERIRQELGYRGPQNYYLPFSDYTLADLKTLLFKGRRARRFYNHIPAENVRSMVGEEIWSSYFTFCFERNPWDKAISWYFWTHKKEPRPSISEYVTSNQDKLRKLGGCNYYTSDGEIIVDRVYRYEELPQALTDIAERLDLEEDLVLPNAKGGFRKDKRHYSEVLSDQDRSIISEIFSEEIALLGYKY